MEIVLDFSSIPSNPLELAWWFFKTIGWIIPVVFLVWGTLAWWQISIRNQYRKKRKYMLLAIDIPKSTEQSPKAVENMFMHLSGAHQPLKFHSKWWTGEVP